MPKKRSPGDGGLFYLPSRNLYRGVIDHGLKPDGTRNQLYVHSKTQAGARAKLDALRIELREHGAPLDKQTKLAVWAAHWLATARRPEMTPNGYRAYESLTNRWIVTTLGTRIVATIKPSDIRLVLKNVTDNGRSSSTALKVYNILSMMLEAARADGMAPRNVCDDVPPPTAAISTVRALTTAEAIAALKTSEHDVDGSKWWLSIYGGIRQGERLAAQIADLDFQNNTYTVRWSLTEIRSEHGCGPKVGTGWPCGLKQGAACPTGRLAVPNGMVYRQLAGRLCLKPPKSGRERVVPIPPTLMGMIRQTIESTKDSPNPHGLIWRNQDGSPILPEQDQQAWRQLLYRAGLITVEQAQPPKDRPEGTPPIPGTHTARHTAATVLMELGVDAKIVGEIVGHQSERVTRNYQHVSAAAATAATVKQAEYYEQQLALE